MQYVNEEEVTEQVREYENAKVNDVKVVLHNVSTNEKKKLMENKLYKTILSSSILKDARTNAWEFVKGLQTNVGGFRYTEIAFNPGEKKGDIEIHYKFLIDRLKMQFPYIYRKNMWAIELNYFHQPRKSEERWYQRLIQDTCLARYQYKQTDGSNHAILIQKSWEKIWKTKYDLALKLKYNRRWVDANARENCFTKQIKLIYDMNEKEHLFPEIEEETGPNYLYAKLTKKARTNEIDTDAASGALLKNMSYPDRLLSFKLGHHNTYLRPGFQTIFKSSLEFGRNKTDAAFVKAKTFLNNYWLLNSSGKAIWFNSIQAGWMAPITSGAIRLNDALQLQGIKGIDAFPGAKTYKSNLVEAGKEHCGDRVANKFIVQYESKLFFPRLLPFARLSSDSGFFLPFIYGTIAYAAPFGINQSQNERIRGAYGIGFSIQTRPVSLDFFYSFGSITPKCDLKKEYGISFGID